MTRSQEFQERLRAASLLCGLTEREADLLLAQWEIEHLTVFDEEKFEDIRVAQPGESRQTLLQWAGQQNPAGAIIVQFDVTKFIAYFAADRGLEVEEINAGVDVYPVQAVAKLFATTHRFAEAHVSPLFTPEELYAALDCAGLVQWQTNPYTILALQERWQEALA